MGGLLGLVGAAEVAAQQPEQVVLVASHQDAERAVVAGGGQPRQLGVRPRVGLVHGASSVSTFETVSSKSAACFGVST